MNMKTMRDISGIQWFALALTAAALLAIATPSAEARDRGVNQPGAAGNRGGAAGGGGRDAGVNQPGRAGNNGYGGGASQTRAAGGGGRDAGVNQPGRAGNNGRRR
jgi:hypothetical protein